MNKLAKGFLLALGAILVLLIVTVLGIHLYVESEGVQARLESSLSKALRMPVKLSQVRFSIWGGLTVSGITIREPQPASATGDYTNFLEAPEISAHVLLRPLFQKKLVITELILSEPKVTWIQNEHGRWRLPRVPLPPPEPKAQPLPISPVPAKSEAGEPRKVELQVRAARMENATFRFLDKDGEPVAVFEGVTVNCPKAGFDSAEGVATINKLTLHDAVSLEEVTTPFSFENGVLTLSKLEGRLAGGMVHGSYTLTPEADGAPFQAELFLEGIELSRFLSEMHEDTWARSISGSVQGSVNLSGHSKKGEMEGKGRLAIHGGHMEQFPIVQMLGQTLQVDADEFVRLDLQQAHLNLHLAGKKITVDDLLLESPNLAISAKGNTGYDGKLDLAARLAISPKIERALPKWIAANFQPRDSTGRRGIDFAITGTIREPQQNLVRVLVGRKIEREAMGLLNFLRGGARHKKKEDRKPEPEPTPVEAAQEAPSGEPAATAASQALQQPASTAPATSATSARLP